MAQCKGKAQAAVLDRRRHSTVTDFKMQSNDVLISSTSAGAAAEFRRGGPSLLINEKWISRLKSAEAAANTTAGGLVSSPFATSQSQAAAAVTNATSLPVEAAGITEEDPPGKCIAAGGSGATASTDGDAEATVAVATQLDSSSSKPAAKLAPTVEARGPDDAKKQPPTVWLNNPNSAVQQLVPATHKIPIDVCQPINGSSHSTGTAGAAAPAGRQVADAVKRSGSDAAARNESATRRPAAKTGHNPAFTSPFAAPAQQVTFR